MKWKNNTLHFGMPFMLEMQSVEDAVVMAKRHGLNFIELNTNFPPSLLDALDTSFLRRVREEDGIYFTLHLDDAISFADLNPRVRAAWTEDVLAAVAFAKKAGIPLLNVHFARGNVVTLPDGKHYIFEEYPEVFRVSLAVFRQRVTEAIGEAPVRIAVENTNGWLAYEQEAISFLLESPAFGLTLDVGHDQMTGNSDRKFIDAHAQHLLHMHLHDVKGIADHRALGAGDVDIAEKLEFARLHQADVLLEVKTSDALEESVAWLRRHLA